MLTKGAIGNLVNRYKAVLKKCNLMNTFGSLAVASMLVMGGSGVASAAENIEKTDGSSVISNAEELNFIYLKHANVTLNNDTFINITNSSSDGIYIGGSDTGTSNLTINTGTLTVTGTDSDFDGENNSAALFVCSNKTPEDLESKNLTPTQADITARDIYLYGKGEACGLIAMSTGIVNLHGNVTIETENNAPAIATRGQSVINIGQNNETVNIKGDIDFNYDKGTSADKVDSTVNINLNNSNSNWIGNTRVSWEGAAPSEDLIVTQMTLNIKNGATWTPTAISNFSNGEIGSKPVALNNLVLDGGNVSVKEGVDVDVEKVSGNGNINMEDAENLGSFTAENAAGAELNVQATDKDGNVKNADGVDAATLTKMRAQVQATDATVTASAAEGDVNGAISIDAKGNVSTAKNTLMDAALKQASITTVALDKILTNDVRKRLGDIRSDKNQTGVWMRWDGGKLKGDGLTNNFNTIQIGGDTKVGTNCRIGVAGSFTHGDTDFARGNGELEGFSFALYSTWMGENGMFADIVTRLGHFSNEMNVEGRKGDMDNRVFSLSGEYGWRFDLCKQFFLEPQVELAYTYVSSDDLQLGTARYAFDNVNSLVGRAGLVAGWNLPDDMGNVYARASVLQQFMGDAKISGSNGNAFNVQEIDGNDTWMEYGIGANVKLTEKTYIWADVERTAGADLDEEWRGTVGLRYSF